MKKHQCIVCMCVCVMATAFVVGGASTRAAQPVLSNAQQGQQLGRLGPGNLDGYLRIGEQLGADAQTDQQRDLAMQTLTIGIGLAQRAGNAKLAASMCIALASVEPDPVMASSLWDLAYMLDPDRRWAWVAHRDAKARESAQLRRDAARAVYAARFHDPQLATELFGKKAVRETLRQGAHQAGLDPVAIDRLLFAMIADASEDDCRGRVFVTQRNDGEVRRVVCGDHRRPIGAGPDDESLRQLIKLELVLLDALWSPTNRDAWEVSAYLEMDGAMGDVSVSSIVAHYRVDLTRPYWRGDRWASSP